MSDEAPCLLKVGEAMLAGEIEYRKGNFDTAFEHLRDAVRCGRNGTDSAKVSVPAILLAGFSAPRNVSLEGMLS